MEMITNYFLLISFVLGAFGDDIPDISWSRVSDGVIPSDALVAGHGKRGTDTLYACRSNTSTGISAIGQFMTGHYGCVISMDNKRCRKYATYDILVVHPWVNYKLDWVPSNGNVNVPSSTVSDGSGNYVGRTRYGTGLFPGTVSPRAGKGLGFCPGHNHRSEKSYDILVYVRRPIKVYRITNVAYDMGGLRVANESHPMGVAHDITHNTVDTRLTDIVVNTKITFSYENEVARSWTNVSNYNLEWGIPVSINGGVLGITANREYGILAESSHSQTTGEEEIHSMTIQKEVSLDNLPPESGCTKVSITAQTRRVTIPYEAIMQVIYMDGSSGRPHTIQGEYKDVQHYEVYTNISYTDNPCIWD